MSATTEKAILAGGCFWGMQDLIRKRPGVITTRVGYTGGDVANATYRNHGTHAEAIEITFDPSVTSYRDILEFFFQIHDPTTKNRQGNDVGLSYRSAIFYVDDEQKRVAEDTIADVEASGPVARQGGDRGRAGGTVLGGRARAPGLPGALPERVHVPLPSAGVGPAPAERRPGRVGPTAWPTSPSTRRSSPAVPGASSASRRTDGGSTSAVARHAATSAAATARRASTPASTPNRTATPSSGASSPVRTGSGTTRQSSTTTAPELAPPEHHPASQPTPGPAGRVPADWERHLH